MRICSTQSLPDGLTCGYESRKSMLSTTCYSNSTGNVRHNGNGGIVGKCLPAGSLVVASYEFLSLLNEERC